MTNDPTQHSTEASADCGGCALHDSLNTTAAIKRREFIRAAGLVLASLGMLGAGSRSAEAMSNVSISDAELLPRALGDRQEEKRYAAPATDGVSIDKDNSVIIARVAGKVYAFSLACPHQNTALRWEASDNEFFCPKHKSRYKPDGAFISGRATRDMDRLPIRKDGAVLVVDIDGLIQQDEHQKEWSAAYVAA